MAKPQQASMSNWKSKVNESTINGGGNYVRDGSYTWIVETMQLNDGNEGLCHITELRVVESEQDPDYPDVRPNPTGSSVSVVYNLTKHEAASGNVKGVMAAVLGGLGFVETAIVCAPEGTTEHTRQVDEWGKIQDSAVAQPDNRMRGVVVRGKTFRKKIKTGENAGKPITLVKWSPVADQSLETLAVTRKKLDEKPVADAAAPKPAAPAAAQPTATEEPAKAEPMSDALKKALGF